MLSRIIKSAEFWMVVQVAAFAVMQVFVKLTSANVSVYMQVMVRNMLGIIVSGYYIRKNGLSAFGPREEQPYLFARSIAGFLGLVSFFYATRLGNIADATIINRTGPFFTTLFAVIFLKEKTHLRQWIALIIVFLGGVIAANPHMDSSVLPIMLAFTSAICNGIAYTALAHFKGRVHAMTVVMHFSVICVLASVPFVIHKFSVPDLHDACMLFMIAVMGCIGIVSITLAYRLAPASEVSIYDQLGIVASVLTGWAIFGEAPSLSTILGGSIIIAVSFISFVYNKQSAQQHENQ